MDSTVIAALIQAGGLIVAAIIVAVFGRRQPGIGQSVSRQPDPPPARGSPGEPRTGRVRSVTGDVPTPIEFHNVGDEPLKLFWIDYTGKPVLAATLCPGEIARQNTFVTHPWIVTDQAGTPLLVHYTDPDAVTVRVSA
jgi:hypothetical protein